MEGSVVATRFWHPLDDGRVECDVCPRACKLREGQRGLCFIRERRDGGVVLTSYGRSSGLVVDPIEKKPLAHFLPGSSVLSFGTVGCNLTCRYCQNWDISKARSGEILSADADPETIARTAVELGCEAVAFTYNDPVPFLEYAVDTARAVHARRLRTVAVTAGYVRGEARAELFRHVDAANVDLKAFSERFYRELCGGSLAAVQETLVYLRRETKVWLEITNLLIPGWNDSVAETEALARWVVEALGPDVPIHFSRFYPAFRMRDVPPTPPATVERAREIARRVGARYVYTGNLDGSRGESTFCPECGELLVGRVGYRLTEWNLGPGATCGNCGTTCPGVFDDRPGSFGGRIRRAEVH